MTVKGACRLDGVERCGTVGCSRRAVHGGLFTAGCSRRRRAALATWREEVAARVHPMGWMAGGAALHPLPERSNRRDAVDQRPILPKRDARAISDTGRK